MSGGHSDTRGAGGHLPGEDARRAERRARLLADVSLALNANVDDLDRALDAVVERVGSEIGDTCSIYLRSADGQWLECVAQYIHDPAQRARGESVGVRTRRFHVEGNAL